MHFLIRHHAAYNFWKHQSTVSKQIYIKSCSFDCFFDNRSGTNGTEIEHAKHTTKLQRSKRGHASNHSQIYVALISGFAWSFLPPSSITPSCEKRSCTANFLVLYSPDSPLSLPTLRRAIDALFACWFAVISFYVVDLLVVSPHILCLCCNSFGFLYTLVAASASRLFFTWLPFLYLSLCT